MEKSQKTRKIIALSTGAAVALSAVAIVTLQEPGTSSERLNAVQSALRDGAKISKVSPDTGERVRLACSKCDR